MLNKAMIILLMAALTGCASPLPKEVKIPVGVKCPAATIPQKPHLPIADLKTDSPPNTVMKAYAVSINNLQSHCDDLTVIIKSYGQ